jgi:thiopeptide-type bacteriocin biosynthesis protein
VVDLDTGVGFPDGYTQTTPPEAAPLTPRDHLLLTLAQRAALDGCRTVELDETLISQLDRGPARPRLPSHLEVSVRVHAVDLGALQCGDFTIEVLSVSRGAGVLTGRFLPVLAEPDRDRLAAALSDLPAGDPDTVVAQLSYPPLDPAVGHVVRTHQTQPVLISLAEHRPVGGSVLTVADLAVACDGRRLYLAAPARGRRIEAVAMHALNPRVHTPPLARFLVELGRAQCAQVTAFDWGAAARLPFLPQLKYGRTIVTPARWRIAAHELPGHAASWDQWRSALDDLVRRRHVPDAVHLVDGDRRLPLDLADPNHQLLLRTHLDRAGHAVHSEAPIPEQLGWCDGRAHEVIVPLRATAPPGWPRLPAPSPARIIGREHGLTPGASTTLLAKLYGDRHRQDVLLAEHLPELLAQWPSPPRWWYLRFRDPQPHLRLRLALLDTADFGPSATQVSTWADRLRRLGLLREVMYATSYPETGRWGDGPAMRAVEDVFAADSATLLAQLRQRVRPSRQALVAAHAAAIAAAFTGSDSAGMRWLIDHIPATAPQPVPRPVFTEAVRIADPSAGWHALATTPGGVPIVAAWATRSAALAAYRAHLPGPHTIGVDTDDVLGSLLHAHYIRAVGIDFDDEAVCLYLARAAALAWSARTNGGTS